MVARRFSTLVVDPPEPWSLLLALVVAGVAVGGAIAAAALHTFTSYSLIVAGVMAATWYAGLRFGLAALAVATALSWVFVAEPRGELGIEPAELVRLCIGIATAAGAAVLIDNARRGWRTAEQRETRVRELLDEVTSREVRFATMADALPVLISYVDAQRRYVFNNRAYETWFETAAGDIEGERLPDVLGEVAYERIRGYVDQALRGTPVSFEANVPYKNAGTRWVHADYVPDFAPDGAVRGFFALVVDQTDRKRSEDALAASEARARGVLEGAEDGIITINESGRIESFNLAAERLFGYRASEVIGRNVSTLMPSPDAENHDRYLQTYLTTGQARIIGTGRDLTALRKDGTKFPIRLAVSEVFLPTGRIFTGIVHDLSIRVRALTELKKSEKRYRSLAEATASVVWVANAEAQIVGPQPEWEQFTGQVWPEYRGNGFVSMVHPDDRSDLMERWQSALAAGSPQHFPARVWHADSRSWHHCDTFAIPISEDGVEVSEWIGTTTDVEDAYRAQELAQANAVKDEFVGLVSHELKTPVTTILGNAEILQRVSDRLDAQSRNQALEDIRGEADRLQRLIDNMLMLARLDRGLQIELEPVVLPRIVDRVVRSFRERLPERVIVESADRDAVVIASADFVEQVLNNLLSNALKYSPADQPVEIHLERRNGEVVMDVLDRGAGIATEEIDRIFEPFYRSPRTKDSAVGVGVGLAVCRRVIEAQQGRLWAQPREGGGSDFGFALPAASEAEA